MRSSDIALVLVSVVLILALLFGFKMSRAEPPLSDDFIPAYKVIQIKGMPCILVEGYGITCDWSKWAGEKGAP